MKTLSIEYNGLPPIPLKIWSSYEVTFVPFVPGIEFIINAKNVVDISEKTLEFVVESADGRSVRLKTEDLASKRVWMHVLTRDFKDSLHPMRDEEPTTLKVRRPLTLEEKGPSSLEITCEGRSFLIVGVSHYDVRSKQDINDAFRLFKPDSIVVELDEGRSQILEQKLGKPISAFRSCIRFLRALLIQPLSIWLEELYNLKATLSGHDLFGAELFRAVELAREHNIPVTYGDTLSWTAQANNRGISNPVSARNSARRDLEARLKYLKTLDGRVVTTSVQDEKDLEEESFPFFDVRAERWSADDVIYSARDGKLDPLEAALLMETIACKEFSVLEEAIFTARNEELGSACLVGVGLPCKRVLVVIGWAHAYGVAETIVGFLQKSEQAFTWLHAYSALRNSILRNDGERAYQAINFAFGYLEKPGPDLVVAYFVRKSTFAADILKAVEQFGEHNSELASKGLQFVDRLARDMSRCDQLQMTESILVKLEALQIKYSLS